MPGGARAGGPACGYCHAGALYLVTRDVPGSPGDHACKGHLAVAVEKVAERTGGAGAVDVYLLSGGSALGGGPDVLGEILERVRRVGAHSVKDPRAAHALEDELHLAVLALIAQGGQNPAGMAAAALQTRRYEFERWTG